VVSPTTVPLCGESRRVRGLLHLGEELRDEREDGRAEGNQDHGPQAGRLVAPLALEPDDRPAQRGRHDADQAGQLSSEALHLVQVAEPGME
jgi:hypothetical protein